MWELSFRTAVLLGQEVIRGGGQVPFIVKMLNISDVKMECMLLSKVLKSFSKSLLAPNWKYSEWRQIKTPGPG